MTDGNDKSMLNFICSSFVVVLMPPFWTTDFSVLWKSFPFVFWKQTRKHTSKHIVIKYQKVFLGSFSPVSGLHTIYQFYFAVIFTGFPLLGRLAAVNHLRQSFADSFLGNARMFSWWYMIVNQSQTCRHVHTHSHLFSSCCFLPIAHQRAVLVSVLIHSQTCSIWT